MSNNRKKSLLNIIENLNALTHTFSDITASKNGRGTRIVQAKLIKAQMLENLVELETELDIQE